MKNEDLLKSSITKEEAEAFNKANPGESAKIRTGKLISQWFQVDITIRMFGVVIFEYHWPPEKS